MALNVEKILREIGWNNGWHIPKANAENQALEAELENLMVRKTRAQCAFEEATSKFHGVDKHLKYVKQEVDQNQKLLRSYAQQVEVEHHKYIKLHTEYEVVSKDMQQINKRMSEIWRRQEDKKGDLTRTLGKIEELKVGSAWDSEALKVWEESMNRKADGADMLKEFSKLDERKAKELEARREFLQTEVLEKSKILEKVVVEIKSYQQTQETTDKLFKQQEDERRSLINQWQDSVRTLRQRDRDIDKVNKDVRQVQQLILEKKEKLEAENAFLKGRLNANKKIEKETEELSLLYSRMKNKLREITRYTTGLINNENILKRSLATVSMKLGNERQVCKIQEKQKIAVGEKLTKIMQEIERLERKLNEIITSSMSATEKGWHLQQMTDAEEATTNKYLYDNEKMQAVLLNNQAALNEARNIGKSMDMQISATRKTNECLEEEIQSKMHDVFMQSEVAYELANTIKELDLKLCRYDQTHNSDEEVEKISVLKTDLAKQNELTFFLQTQLAKLHDEIRRFNVAIAAEAEKILILKAKLQEQTMLFDGAVKQIADVRLRSQAKQAEQNVLRLRAFQLEKAITNEDDSICDLQKLRVQLEVSLKDRQIEIQTSEEILREEKKNLEGVLNKLRIDINQKIMRIEQFQTKHHLALTALGSNEVSRPLSISHVDFKNAQEKNLLLQEGEKLNNKVRKAEKEIIAMENTLKVVNMTTDAYKKSLTPSDEEYYKQQLFQELELQRTEQELYHAAEVLKQQRKVLSEKRKRLTQLEEDVLAIQRSFDDERGKLKELENTYLNLKQEEVIREEKIIKTFNNLKAYKDLVPKASLEIPEKNLEIQQLQDANNFALHQLASFLDEHKEATSTVMEFLHQYNLELPSIVKTAAAASSTSTLSLTTSSHSTTCTSSTSTEVLCTNYLDDNSQKQ